MHQACIPEQGYCELSIKTTVDSAGKDLMDQIIHYAMQEVVPWKVEEQILRERSEVVADPARAISYGGMY